MWIDTNTLEIARSHSDVRILRPNWSAPSVLTDEMIEGLGFAEITPTLPDCNPVTEYAVEIAPHLTIEGVWFQAWQIIPRSAEEITALKTQAKLDKWEEIKVERLRRTIGTGVPVAGKWFQTDIVSRTQYLTLDNKAFKLAIAGSPGTTILQTASGPVYWKTMDNSFIPITIQLIHDIVQALEDQEAAVFKQAETHKAIMEASASPSIYNFSTGWPPAFGET
jgi:hypothetical protein